MENTNSPKIVLPVELQPGSLKDEYQFLKELFESQPSILQRFLEVQARQVADSYIERSQRVKFILPDRVLSGKVEVSYQIPESERTHIVGSFGDRLVRRDVHITLRQKLTELESSTNKGVALGARLLRYGAVQYIVNDLLPSGRSVTYEAAEDEEIPSIPVAGIEPESAITASSDAIAEESPEEIGRGSLQVPYVPAARRFYLPQWVSFDDDGDLLVNSVDEAWAHLASMQKYLDILFTARSLAPYIVEDEEFQRKRYGMLGQLVNQGRALAFHMTQTIIATIKERAAAQSLNRGLGLHLPFFDDQDLRIEYHDFVVIPAGRIMFVPAFVVRAVQDEQAKVSQDTRLSLSTRKHLLSELASLEEAFRSS